MNLRVRSDPRTRLIPLNSREEPDRVVAWAKVLPEHLPLVTRFQWRLQDGIPIAVINGDEVNMEALINCPRLADHAPSAH